MPCNGMHMIQAAKCMDGCMRVASSFGLHEILGISNLSYRTTPSGATLVACILVLPPVACGGVLRR